MQTHRNEDFLERLRERADKCVDELSSTITAGKPGEEPLASWRRGNVDVKQLADDEQGILRISVGGGQTPVPLNYVVFRGNHGECVDLLRRALAALERRPS